MNARRELAIIVGLGIAWALSLWTNTYEEFSLIESRLYALHCFIVLVVESVIYLFFSALAKKKIAPAIIPLLLVTGFCVANFYLLILIHDDRVAGFGTMATVLLVLGLLAFCFLIINGLRTMALKPKFVYALVVIFILFIGGGFQLKQYAMKQKMVEITKMPEHVTFPKFTKRPNVYVIFFDALVPESITKKYLDVDKLPYMDLLRQKGFRVFKNVFADDVGTKQSINSFLAMDQGYYQSIEGKSRYLFDTNEVIGPFAAIFKHNDYKSQFIISTSRMGSKGDSNLDFYAIAKDQGLCIHSSDYALLGYCLPALKRFRARLTGDIKKTYPLYFHDRIRETIASTDSWLTWAYLLTPGHTPRGFRYDRPEDIQAYALDFKNKRAPRTANIIEQFITLLHEEDPESIVVIIGDHGMWLSTKMNKRPLKSRLMSARDIFLDRHPVAAAIYPKDFCFDEFTEPLASSRIGRNIIKCLSGGVDPLPADYQVNDNRFLEYIYE